MVNLCAYTSAACGMICLISTQLVLVVKYWVHCIWPLKRKRYMAFKRGTYAVRSWRPLQRSACLLFCFKATAKAPRWSNLLGALSLKPWPVVKSEMCLSDEHKQL